jgi:hypothetical protein
LNGSVDVDGEASKKKIEQKCLVLYQANYYLIDFIASEVEYNRFKRFIKKNFHILMGFIKMN